MTDRHPTHLAALAGTAVRDEFAPSVWDAWNAKSPRAQVDASLAADAALAAALEALDDEKREGLSFAAGPIGVGFEGFVGLRLNEHALHTWDIDVALDHAATIGSSIPALVVDNLELIGRYTANQRTGSLGRSGSGPPTPNVGSSSTSPLEASTCCSQRPGPGQLSGPHRRWPSSMPWSCPGPAATAIWLGAGGSPGSVLRAAELGVPMFLGILGGTPEHWAHCGTGTGRLGGMSVIAPTRPTSP